MGNGCLEASITDIAKLGFKKTLVVTDAVLNEIGLVGSVVEKLGSEGISSVVFDGTQPNPTCGG